MGSQPGIVLCFSEYESVRKILTQAQKGDLLDALMNFGDTGETYTGDDPLVGMAFNIFSASISRIRDKYVERCERNKENARKRWEKRIAENAVAYDRIRSDAKQCESTETKTETQTETETESVKKKRSVFLPPTVEEVSAYCQERRNTINAEQFVNYYEARGWELKPGQKMKDWKASVRTWESNQRSWTNELRGSHENDRVAGQRELYGL